MSKRLGGIIGCKYKTSSWHLNGFPYDSNIVSTVVIPFILDVRFVDVPAGVTQEDVNTGFVHFPSVVLALIFLPRRIHSFPSSIVESIFILCTNDLIVLHLLGFFFL